VIKITAKKLMKTEYHDAKAETRLEAYADTVVIEKEGYTSYIAAIRFGGYPESVKGMSEAICGGGSVRIEIDDVPITVYSRVKQYRKEISHDGIYAEATLLIQDEEQRTGADDNDGGDKNTSDRPRKCYLFCEQGDSEELDKKTAVPLIPEFKEYVLGELQNRNILKPLQVISNREKFDVWLLTMTEDEKNIVDVVNDGLKTGAISIPGSEFPAVHSVTQYLNTFGIKIAERIKNQFEPLFDPAAEALSREILAVNANIKANVGYSLYDAQLAVAEAHKRCLERKKATLCIAECGSGKTKIGITALHAYQQRNRNANHAKHFNVVLCSSHMTKKWVREIEESLPNTFATVITSITELRTAYSAYERDNKTCYVIMSKEKARDGYMQRPAAIWNRRRSAFICPSCYGTIEMELINDGSKYRVPADAIFFKRENKQNHKCGNCGEVLWTVLSPEQQTEWVENQVKDGIQVLITNPSLVETGLDLNDFTTLYYYNIAYNLFTLRQSSRRSWRINQKAPRIEVYFAYYEGTMQNRAIRLMASKLAVAGIIEGNFTDEGLAAMSDCADMTTALARELTNGIKNEVENLSSVFKKMAVLKPAADQLAIDVVEDGISAASESAVYPIIYTEEDISEIVAHLSSGLHSGVTRKNIAAYTATTV
jgi:hypothetical protein